jgi:hypothetical protein
MLNIDYKYNYYFDVKWKEFTSKMEIKEKTKM